MLRLPIVSIQVDEVSMNLFGQIVGAQIALRVGDRRFVGAADCLLFDQHRQCFEIQPFPTAALL